MGKIFKEGFSFSGFERDKLYLSREGTRFEDISGLSGIDAVGDGRGAAYADFDNDGDLDIFLTQLQGQVHQLFRNNVGQDQNWLRVQLRGTASGRDAWGAEVRVGTSRGTQTQLKAAGSGFVSQGDARLLFGLGADVGVQWMEVRWPSGTVQRFGQLAAGVSVEIVEGVESLSYLDLPRAQLPEPADENQHFLQALRYGPGDEFPPLLIIDEKGIESDFHTYRRADRKYLLNLWATYCVPCRAEMPALQELAAPLGKAGVEVLGISLDMGKNRKKIPRFLQKLGIDYPIFTTDEQVFTHVFAGEEIFIPLSFIIDEQGRISDVLTGWSPESEARIRRLLEP